MQNNSQDKKIDTLNMVQTQANQQSNNDCLVSPIAFLLSWFKPTGQSNNTPAINNKGNEIIDRKFRR